MAATHVPANIPPALAVYTGVSGEAAAIPDGCTRVEPDGLDRLFDTHHRRLYGLARRLSRSGDEARDLVQETFLRAAQARASVPSEVERQEAWLVRVLVNICRDQWRRRATVRRYDARGERLSAPQPSNPETALVARSMVERALALLAPRRRTVIVMHELEGAGIDAIARTLGITAVTVRWHLSRGRRQLAGLLREQGIPR